MRCALQWCFLIACRVGSDTGMWAYVAVLALTAAAVLGDYFLKLASAEEDALWNRWFLLGLTVLSATTFGWVFIMRHMKLAAIGIVYSITMILLLALVGVLCFEERLNIAEVAGLALAIAALVLLVRFGE